jgi:two-component system chemotaxis response regulator CheB
VLHVPATSRGALAHILDRAGPLPAAYASDGEGLRSGRIYVAPPDRHLVVDEGRILRTTRGPQENGLRPAVDPLFRSAARRLGASVVGVVLTGTLDDGTAGLAAVRKAGGLAIVQDPETAMYPSMPASALRQAGADHVRDVAGIAAVLREVVGQPAAQVRRPRRDELDPVPADAPGRYGCPDCGGVLAEVPDGDVLRFRCRVGHAWTSGSLAVEQARRLEGALWVALRTLEERTELASRMADQADRGGHEVTAKRFREKQAEAVAAADLVKQALFTELEEVESFGG